MDRVNALLGFLAAFPLLIGCTDLPQSTPLLPTQGPLHVDSDSLSIGIVRAGEEGVGSIKVVNRGSSTISINEVSTSCSCLAGKLSRNSLLPGDEAQCAVRLITSTTDSNTVTRQLVIKYTSGDRDFALPLSARVQIEPTGLVANPRQISLGSIGEGKEFRQQVQLISRSAFSPNENVTIVSSPAWLNAQLIDSDGHHERNLVVHGTAPQLHGPVLEHIELRQERDGRPPEKLSVPVTGRVESSVILTPSTVVEFLKRSSTRHAPVEILVSSTKNETLRLLAVDIVEGERDSVEVTTRESGRALVFQLAPSVSPESHSIKGALEMLVRMEQSKREIVVRCPFLFILD
jgi:hypothetical protein